jgi:hypothetical protein
VCRRCRCGKVGRTRFHSPRRARLACRRDAGPSLLPRCVAPHACAPASALLLTGRRPRSARSPRLVPRRAAFDRCAGAHRVVTDCGRPRHQTLRR